ncbi:MAG: guanylate kinase [Saprospirales bacterium]|nr:MAG: guanylate kinase [Saprospirales bacterium]
MSEGNQGGKMIIITAPSGAGKTTIVKHLKSTFPQLEFSVSVTTRPKRDVETHGIDYFFLSREEFRELIRSKKLLEWQEVYPNQYYGTLLSEVHRITEKGKSVLFDIDVKGAANLKREFSGKSLAIFIKPPSMQILLERLIKRGSESPEQLKKRIIKLKEELSYESFFDKVLVNNKLEDALKEAELLVEEFLMES